LLSGGLWTVILSLDISQASAVAKWLAAPTEGKEAAYSVVATLVAIGRGIYAMSIMVYWLALVFLDIGMVRSAVYPRWLGWADLLCQEERKLPQAQREVAFVPPGHGSGGCLLLDLHTRPLARSLRTLPDRRTPSRSLLGSLPVTGTPRRPGDGAAHRAELVAPSRGPHGSRRRLGVCLLGGEKTVTLVHCTTTPHGIEQAHPLIG
jgi:hypothetical protein